MKLKIIFAASVLSALLVGGAGLSQTPNGEPSIPEVPIEGIEIDTAAIVTALSAYRSAAYTALESLTKASLVCRVDTDCVAVAVGAKACGGPSGYVVTSKFNDFYTGGEIESLAKKTEEYSKAINNYLGLISDCSIEMPPTLECDSRARACVIPVN
ncbi:MAG: hypothetical protein KBD78_02210 [Oligoflexales bacterium]|nr:hypothetical protein [Oligoflexales bacterium]